MIPPATVPAASVSRTLLIVDDQASVRLSLEFMLGGCGYRIVSVGGGAEALARMDEEPADGALIDVHMPVMNGFETCQRLQAAAARLNRPLRVWFMTGAGGQAVEKRCADLGALAVLSKPFELGDLVSRLEAGFATAFSPVPTSPVAS